MEINILEEKLKFLNTDLFSRLGECRREVELLLQQYSSYFPTYTDHSLKHTEGVYQMVGEVLNDKEIENLNAHELYVLSMASLLHDIGMCIPESKIAEVEREKLYTIYKEQNPEKSKEELIRDLHHELSYDFIIKEYKLLKIPNEEYAKAIALTARAHRKVELLDVETYKAKFFVLPGRRNFVCLPYLGAVLRIADELDITNSRTPELLTKYYLPQNEKSKLEWEKHISTSLVNMDNDTVIIKARTKDQSVLHALQAQFSKIEQVIEYCQKVIRHIGQTDKVYSLTLSKLKTEIDTNILSKNIKFSIDVPNVIETLMGKNLYQNDLAPIRELIQNALDTCLYKRSLEPNYLPEIQISLFNDYIKVSDNGLGMDEYIIEKYYSKLSSSFYKSETLKSKYDPIGRFGIGVFSYFMISDFIEVETKSKNGNSIKFRADKDPDNYFYFYEDVEKGNIGTDVSLYYSKEFKNKNIEELIEFIESTFAFVDVPITINSESMKVELKKRELKTNLEDFVNNNIHQHFKPLFKDLEVIELSFSTEEAEGFLSFYYNFSYRSLTDENLINGEEKDKDYRTGDIKVFNHGVFVSNTDTYLIDKVLGTINLKKNANLSLNRNQIIGRKSLIRPLLLAEIEIAEKYLSKSLNENKLKNWKEFVDKILRRNHNFYDDEEKSDNIELYYQFFINNMVFQVFKNGETKLLNFSGLFNYSQFHLITSPELIDIISQKSKEALVLIEGFTVTIFKKIIKDNGFALTIIKVDDEYLDLFTKEIQDKLKYLPSKNKRNTFYSESFENVKAFIMTNKFRDKNNVIYYSQVIVNNNHPIIYFLVSVIEDENGKYSKVQQVFAQKMLDNFQEHLAFFSGRTLSFDSDRLKTAENNILKLINEINKFFGSSFKFDLNEDLDPDAIEIVRSSNLDNFFKNIGY